ncbi:hypothetical protein GCM10010464_12830 [Pseudonocardia yunnanensis]|uniref:Core-binding (CB) domain-containing protein n=1 Tax=Pseudonocardia yunnanensis TaxID=58107 RepID=A0ABW4ESP1_9PSEU
MDQLLARYLDQFDGAPNTLTLYRGYVRNHISPFLGQLTVGALDTDVLDAGRVARGGVGWTTTPLARTIATGGANRTSVCRPLEV